jgi:hypothetical protein
MFKFKIITASKQKELDHIAKRKLMFAIQSEAKNKYNRAELNTKANELLQVDDVVLWYAPDTITTINPLYTR